MGGGEWVNFSSARQSIDGFSTDGLLDASNEGIYVFLRGEDIQHPLTQELPIS